MCKVAERAELDVIPVNDDNFEPLRKAATVSYDKQKNEFQVDDDFFQIAPPTGEDAVTEGSYDASNPEDTQWSQINYRVTLDKQELSQIVEAQTLQIRLEVEDEDPTSQWATIDEDFCGNIPDDDNPCQDISTYVFDPTEFSESGQDYFEIPFYVRKDLNVEAGDEKIRVYLENDQGISFAESIYIIKEDDFPELLVSYTYTEAADGSEIEGTFTYFMEEGIEINEPSSGGEGVLTLKLDLSAEQSANFTLKHQVSNDESTSIDVNDYTATPSDETTDIPAGTTKGVEIEIRIKDDSLYESTENIELEVEGIGVVLIAIKDTDFPALEFKKGATVISSGTLTEIQEQAVTETNIAGNNLVFDYNLALANAVVARSEFELSYELLSYRPDESVQGCDYLSQDQAVWGEDYNVYLGGVVTEPEAPVIFNQGQSSVSLRIEVVNDSLVECEEYLSLKFILGTDVDGGTVTTASTTTANFSIDNKDKTTLSVSGWSVEEGSSDEAVPPSTTASYSLALGQALNTSLTYTISNSSDHALSCGDDLVSTPSTGSQVFNSLATQQNIPVNILQDNTVEPDETCVLTVTGYDDSIVDVSNGINAEGVIQNDDFLTVTVTTNDTAEPEADNAKASIGTYSWDKDIAANVGPITLLATKENCADGVDCIEDEDTSFGSDETQSIHIHNGTNSQQTNSNTDTPAELPIDIIGDSVVENIETLSFDITVLNGAAYLEPVSKNEIETNYLIDISSTDTLAVFLSQESSDCNDPDNHEIACTLIYLSLIHI